MAIGWGTEDRVVYIEPTYGFPISLGVRGQMSLRVEDSRKLLVKLVGTEASLTRKGLVSFFRAFLATRVKTYIANAMSDERVSVFEVDARLSEFSEAVRRPLSGDFAAYGVALESFLVTGVERPEDDPQYRRFKDIFFRQYADVAEAGIRQQVRVIEAQTEAQETVIASQAMATKRAQEGYTYQQERGFDVARAVAANEAVGQFTGMGVGLGAMAGVGGAMAGVVGGAVGSAVDSSGIAGAGVAVPAPGPGEASGSSMPSGAMAGVAVPVAPPAMAQTRPPAQVCSSCSEPLPAGARFCPSCGSPVAAAVCASCGETLTPGARFCMACGAKV
jgi:hypothetical protein